jgi:hypothetical protein
MRKISQLVGLWIDRDTRSDRLEMQKIDVLTPAIFKAVAYPKSHPPVISEQNDSKETPNASRKSSIVWPHGRSAT